MPSPINPAEETDAFYGEAEGFGYKFEKVKSWLQTHIALPNRGRVLDLCCGDGIWSMAMQELQPGLDLYGLDISQGGVNKARERLPKHADQYVVADSDVALPYPEDYFDMIFVRGAGIFNQHDMTRPGTVSVISAWHSHLKDKARLYSIYGSKPELMGSYTPIDKVKLPYNKVSRQTDAVDFRGGKYNHTIQSFLAPYWATETVHVRKYSFVTGKHVAVTQKIASESRPS